MEQEVVANLVELVDKNARVLSDWDYMQIMVLTQQLYQAATKPPRYQYVGYGASAQQLAADYHRLTQTHDRLKRRNKQRLRRWKEQERIMRARIDELMAEVEYLEQNHHKTAI